MLYCTVLQDKSAILRFQRFPEIFGLRWILFDRQLEKAIEQSQGKLLTEVIKSKRASTRDKKMEADSRWRVYSFEKCPSFYKTLSFHSPFFLWAIPRIKCWCSLSSQADVKGCKGKHNKRASSSSIRLNSHLFLLFAPKNIRKTCQCNVPQTSQPWISTSLKHLKLCGLQLVPNK